ncbi:MAG TPA: hypothetical protein VJZ69_03295 [Clostridia bacterium]|nr:hypothetical protein [Clostridia bacterium]
MDFSINTQELLDEVTNKSKPIFYNAEKLSLSVDLANSSAKPKFLKKEFPVLFEENEKGIPVVWIVGTTLRIPSFSLAKHLEGCKKVELFCATLGHNVDKKIERAKTSDIELAVLLDLAYLLIVEKMCDFICSEVKERNHTDTTPRFSLGYGDSPLTLQQEFLQLLNADKRLGILVTEGGMMLPSKTVTAIIGIK